MNQTDFAAYIGSSYRTYQGRLQGSQPYWTLLEVIRAAELNQGKIIVNQEGKNYRISISEIDD